MAKGSVAFDETYCKGCALCIQFCAKGVIELDTKRLTPKGYHPAVAVNNDECTGCENCSLMCPDSAITVFKE